MSGPAESGSPGPEEGRPPPTPEHTRRIWLPPVPGRGSAPDAEPPPLVDQPTDELAPPQPREPTESFGPWQPLQPRVVPRYRSRTPWVVALLVLLVVAVGVVVVIVYG
jgi:hypothetical protein